MPERGTRSCYQSGCDHPECAEANREYAAERRRAAGVPKRKVGRSHGLSGYIIDKCKCAICSHAYSEYRKNKRAS